MNKRSEIKQGPALAYWSATLLTGALFAAPGALLLARQAHFVEDMALLGYPGYLLPILGVWKILGALAILAPGLPRLKEWAYAGMMFDVSGALASRAAAGSDPFKIIVPLMIAGLVIASWALRPNGRKLQGSIV
jgi:uncharacterized membrane protein YphA (DoxX/SURF4 family)